MNGLCYFNNVELSVRCLPAHSSGWRLLQIRRLKDQTHFRTHLNDLTTHQTQLFNSKTHQTPALNLKGFRHVHCNIKMYTYLLVIVQNSVHVLNPDRVDGPIEYDPLAVVCGALGLLSERGGQNTVWPLVTHWIKTAIQLPHSDRLRINDAEIYCKLFHQPF